MNESGAGGHLYVVQDSLCCPIRSHVVGADVKCSDRGGVIRCDPQKGLWPAKQQGFDEANEFLAMVLCPLVAWSFYGVLFQMPPFQGFPNCGNDLFGEDGHLAKVVAVWPVRNGVHAGRREQCRELVDPLVRRAVKRL